LNDRRRKTLDFVNPAERFRVLLAQTRDLNDQASGRSLPKLKPPNIKN
jgi:hypothetical protein